MRSMEKQVILCIKFPYNDSIAENNIERIKRFENFFYNTFFSLLKKEEIISFEIAAIQGTIHFYIVTPEYISESIALLFFSDFPNAEITALKEYPNIQSWPSKIMAMHIQVKGNQAFSLRTISKTNGDSLNLFFTTIANIPSTDILLYQLVIEPIDDVTQEASEGGIYGFTEKEEIEELKPTFNTSIRILYFSRENENLKNIEVSLKNVFSPFSTGNVSLQVNTLKDPEAGKLEFLQHRVGQASTLNTEELAGIFHSPDPKAKIKGIDWLFTKKAESPMNLPTLQNTDKNAISIFGVTNFRGEQVEFGINREDRKRHLYVVGKSGFGKSKLMESLIRDDIQCNKGVCVIDPHGDLIQDILRAVPKERINDVVYFNPADLDFPIAFNPLENVAREFKQQTTQGLIEIFKKFFGADWTPKIEHVFRFTILALLDYKKSSIFGLQKMLTDRRYRQKVVAEIQDQVVKKFWTTEFAGWSEKFDNEAIVPLINKLGQFLSNEMVRNIVGQSSNKVDFNDIMNNGKILLIELAKGKLGEENLSLLGSLLITKIQQEGMARAIIPQNQRKDFYLYVDEFQHFATRSFENILSESRKYGLNLTISHQYLAQLAPSVRETIFGNVSSIITFRLGANDAKYMTQEMAPHFTVDDIMNLSVREIYVKMSIRGLSSHPFSARTIDISLPLVEENLWKEVINNSRSKYATPLEEVEREFREMYVDDTGNGGEEKKEEKFEQPLI